MPKKTLLVIGLSILLLATAYIFMVAKPPSAPNVHVRNSDTEPVEVVARWRDTTKDIGEIGPGNTVDFSVDDQTAITLDIKRANGTAVGTGEIDLPSGVSTHVEITRTGVTVTSDAGD